jgi:hypothetical protein
MSEKITVTYEIPAPPDGWVYDGGRKANTGELHYMGGEWIPWDFKSDSAGIYPVAIRKQQWRPATEADVGRTDARFRDDGTAWYNGKLIHVFRDCGANYAAIPDFNQRIVTVYSFCEVPTEPIK